MPRRQPAFTGGLVFHVLNRSVRRMRLFDRDGDYRDFLEILGATQRRTPIQCLAYCVMPNHFHLVLQPHEDGDLSRFMHRMTSAHGRWWHRCHGTSGTGHVYQGRFKALPVSSDAHFLRLCRYVERNPVRADLVKRVEDWQWSSLYQRGWQDRPVTLSEWPLARPATWLEMLQGNDEAETAEIRAAIGRNAPFGPELWRDLIAERLGMSRSVRPRGRPRKTRPGMIFFAP